MVKCAYAYKEFDSGLQYSQQLHISHNVMSRKTKNRKHRNNGMLIINKNVIIMIMMKDRGRFCLVFVVHSTHSQGLHVVK